MDTSFPQPLITIAPSTPALEKPQALGLDTGVPSYSFLSSPTSPTRPPFRPKYKPDTHSSDSYGSSSRRTDTYTDSSAITTPASPRTSTESRSSGEFTAVTIYSMYSDHPPQLEFPTISPKRTPETRHSPLRSRPPSSRSRGGHQSSAEDAGNGVSTTDHGQSSSRPATASSYTSFRDEEEPAPVHLRGHKLSVSAGRHASSTDIAQFHRPTSSVHSSPRTSDGVDDHPRESSSAREEVILRTESPTALPIVVSTAYDNGIVVPPSSASSLRHLSPPGTPSRRDLMIPNNTNDTAGPSRLSPRPISTSSSQLRPRTKSLSPSHSPSVLISENGEAEEADSLHVRSTYARLEQTGVPGDGFEDGIERTRAKAPGYKERRATMWPDGGTELAPQEVEVLSSLDRYGFKRSNYTSRQENRLALLPAAPLLKAPVTVKTPPSSPPLPKNELKSIPDERENPKEVTRIDKWGRMMKVNRRDPGGNVEAWTFDEKKGRKLRERIYKGVPDRWRSAVWWTLLEASQVESKSPPIAPLSSEYKRSRKTAAELAVQYQEWIERPSTHDIQIDLDVPRTISGHVMFHTRYGSGQRALFHVLHSFSLTCESCGYCQGMGPIAATLLCYLDPERTYAAMIRLHDSYDMHSVFSPGFPGLLESIYVQERLTEKLMPDVFAAFKKHMICSTSYATKWYITLFANTFPFQTQLRLWDAFILEGRDAIVMIALAIIWVLRDHLASAHATFETILSLLSSFYVAEQEDALLSWMSKALGDKKLRATMTKWRVDWAELVRTGKDVDALL